MTTTAERESRMAYPHASMQARWSERWEQEGIYTVDDDDPRPKWYELHMYPYPSGDLHVGHWFAMTGADVHARYMRMKGYNVLHPMGFDAFGLNAENAAIERGIHPHTWTMDNMANMRRQLRSMGPMYDLGPRGRYLRARLLQMEPVVLPATLQEWLGIPRQRPRQLVSVVPDRAGERAGNSGRVRTLRQLRHPQGHGAVVLPNHQVRRRTAGSLTDRLARPHQHDADQLDRALRRRRSRFRYIGVRPG